MRQAAVAIALFGWAGALPAQSRADDSLPAILRQWSVEHRMVGMAAGVLDGARRVAASGGVLKLGAQSAVTDTTLFEVGSITKVFTGTILATMVLRHEVALDDPVSKYLPGWKVPAYHGREITLLDLATQSSGLPRLPDNFKPADSEDPYRDYGDDALRAFLGSYTLPRPPGTQYEYSNLGVGLLGRALAMRAGMSYGALLRGRILAPLGMTHTSVEDAPASRTTTATGHNDRFLTVQAWHFDALMGAGAIRSNLRDMLRFADAARDTTKGPLAAALAFAMRPRRAGPGADSIGLAWNHRHAGGLDFVWHNGATAGFHAWLSADPSNHRAAVVLANAAIATVDPIGVQLQAAKELRPPPPVDAPTEIAVPAPSLKKFVGRYELAPQAVFDITVRGDTLFAQLTGQQALPVFPSSPTNFFYKLVAAELSFHVDSAGHVDGLVLKQNGRLQPAAKVP